MIKYQDLKIIAETRLKEAKILYRNKLYDGAVYLCGYVVETSLKARICKHLNIPEYLDDGSHKQVFSSHDFDRLLILSGLSNEISLANAKNKKLFTNWSTLTSWKPESRYTSIGTYSQQDALNIIRALTNKRWGFLNWIKNIW